MRHRFLIFNACFIAGDIPDNFVDKESTNINPVLFVIRKSLPYEDAAMFVPTPHNARTNCNSAELSSYPWSSVSDKVRA